MKISLLGITIMWGVEKCSKLNYQTEKDALRAIRKQASLGRTRYHYYCNDCKAWHLTKMPQKGGG